MHKSSGFLFTQNNSIDGITHSFSTLHFAYTAKAKKSGGRNEAWSEEIKLKLTSSNKSSFE